MKISPFAPEKYSDLPQIGGVKLAACEAGIRYQGRKDLALISLAEGTSVAGVFTRSKTASAAVEWCRHALGEEGGARAIVINSGNANAFTGMRGTRAVEATVAAAADNLDCKPEEVFVASTGVIGEPLEVGLFEEKLASLAGELGPENWLDVAQAIMTTDTFPKLETVAFELDGQTYHLNGMAKGAGMIAPDMATMLSFLFTDAPVSAAVLQATLTEVVETSFNSITIDGDTSTSDTVLLFATGHASETQPLTELSDPRTDTFRSALSELTLKLAQQIVKDGEGISKFVTIHIEGAETSDAARNIGLSIGNSPLVKTALAGEDPNWGRVVMAVGKSGEAADRDKLSIWFGPQRVAHDGEIDPDYVEPDAAEYMKNPEIEITVNVGVGDARATIWTCDLTHDYISINADYRS